MTQSELHGHARAAKAPTALAEISCAGLGVALIAWGIAPAIIERIVTGAPPRFETVAIGSFAVLTGMVFLVLLSLIHRGLRWALWTTHVLSVALVAACGLHGWFADERPAVFPVILAACTMATTWIAIRVKPAVCLDVPITRGATRSAPAYSRPRGIFE